MMLTKNKPVQGEIPPLVGTCLQFCPVKEAKSRKEQRRLHVLERDPAFPIKEFVRSGAGHVTPVPSDLRPLSVLVDAITYLITRVCARTDQPWWLVYEFVSNRVQAVRQDITYQQLTGSDVDYIFQLAVRFYLYAQCRLWRSPINKFDPKLNGDSLQQCLLKIVRHGHTSCPEFEAYHLLVNLGSTESLQHALELSKEVRGHPCVVRAVSFSRAYMENNYIRWFKLAASLSPLEQAAVLPYISAMRRSALAVVSRAYCSKFGAIPVKTLCDWLLLSDVKQTAQLCSDYGLEVSGEAVNFTKKGAFNIPTKAPEDSLNVSLHTPPSLLIMAEQKGSRLK